MANKVVEMPLPPCGETIARLEDMLARAKTGEIRSIAIASVNKNGIVSSCWYNDGQWGTLLGAITHLQNRFWKESDE